LLITGVVAAEGSKINVPPASMVRLPPSGKAVDAAATSVPALTVVPPVKLLLL